MEPTQRVTILSLAQTNSYVAGFLLKGNRDKFVLKEGSSLWFYECEHDLAPLHTHKENCFYKSFYHHTLYYVGPISWKRYSFATETLCDDNRAIIISSEPDGNEYYLIPPGPRKENPPVDSEPSDIRNTIQANTFLAHAAGL